MSDFAFMQSAATEAQQQLAQMMGLPADSDGNVLINGATFKGVYGHPQPVEIMNPGGGFRKLTIIMLTITRDQFVAPAQPQSQQTLTRTDIVPNLTYEIAKVDTNDPLHYVLTLRIVGPKTVAQRP